MNEDAVMRRMSTELERFIDIWAEKHTFEYNGSSWRLFNAGPWWDFCHTKSGCYAFFRDSDCLYVGKSVDLLNRIIQHRRERREFALSANEISLFITPIMGDRFVYDKEAAESILIHELHPVYNKQPGRGHPRLRRNINWSAA